MRQIELNRGGIYDLPDEARPIAVSRTGSTEVYSVDGKFLEVAYNKSGRLTGGLYDEVPSWVRPVNYEWAKQP